MVAWQAGRLDEAIAQQRTVVDWYHRTYGGEHPYTGEAELHFASMLSDSGRHDEAQAGYARAREVLTRVFGPEHPALARVWFESGLDHQAAMRLDDARRAHEEAARLFAASLVAEGPESLAVNHALVTLAIARDDLDEAERRMRWSAEVLARTEASVQDRLDVLGFQITIADRREHHEETIEACRAYFELLAPVPLAPDLETQALVVRTILAIALDALGRHDEAETEARALLDALARQPPDALPTARAYAWLVSGRAAESHRELDQAAKAYRAGLESVASADLTADKTLALRARLQWSVARTTRALGVADRSLALQAREALAEADPLAGEIAEIDAWLREMG